MPATGKPWKASARVGRDDIHWSSGDEERLSIAGCTATVGEAGTTVEVKLDLSVNHLHFESFDRPFIRRGRGA